MTADRAGRGLPRWLTVVLGAAGTAVAVLGLQAAAPVAAPVLLAFVLTVTVHPLIGRLQRAGWPRWAAVTAAVVVVDGALIALVAAVVLSLGQLATVLPTYSAEWSSALGTLRDGLADVGVSPAQTRDVLASLGPGTVVPLLTRLLGGVVGAVGGLVLVLGTALFMCVDAATLPGRLAAAAPASPLGPALASFARRTRSYVVVTTVFGAVVAVLDTLGLMVLGIPLALLWGVLSFVTNYVPNIGFVLGLLPPMLLAFLTGGWQSAVTVLVLYSVLNFVVQSVVQPAVVGDVVGLSVTVTFLSLIVWAWVLGPLGAVLAVPMTLLIQTAVLATEPGALWARTLLAHPRPRVDRRRRTRLRRHRPQPPPDRPAPP